MVYAFSTSPAIYSSSPPARSPSVPIKRGLSKSLQVQAGKDVSCWERRVSDDGSKRASFSSSRTPFSTSSGGGKPPTGLPAAKAQQVHVGFETPSDTASRPVALSPSKLHTKASLLSQQLLDSAFSVSPDFSDILSPRQLYKDQPPLVVVPAGSREAEAAQLSAAQEQHPVFRSCIVRSAYDLAAQAHSGQVRKNGDSVLQHALATAVILAELGLSEDIIAAALLHDVLSDTRMTACQLEEYMPKSVVSLVEKVTRLNEISQVYRDNTHTLEAEKLLEMLTTMSDVSALLVKLADRLHNMRTISALSRCKQVRMATETQEVFAVLANRLGAWSMKSELEDLAFKTLNPEEYAEVAAAIATRAPGNGAQLGDQIQAVSEALRAAGLEVVDVSGRVKNVYGVWKKLQRGGRVEDVYDVQALRVVVQGKHECYSALRVVEGLWAPMPGRFKDYIRNRKANGYQSLHTTVRDASGRSLEVQIRTPKMHYIAEYGFAAHWRYKEKLDREDLWLDRLVQWKKWVATSKLGILDRKLRPRGSPGRDGAIVELAAALRLGEHQQLDGQQQQGQGQPAAAARSSTGSARGGLAAALSRQQDQQQARAAASAERFVERYGLRPIGDEDLQDRESTILVHGPRGARLVDVEAGCTLWGLLRSRRVPESELRGCGVQLNGELVVGAERWQRHLRAGDHVELVEPGRVSRDIRSPAEPALARAPSSGLEEEGMGGLYASGRGESLDLERELARRVTYGLPAAAVVG